MAIGLDKLHKVTADKPPIILIYGPEKVGKTSLAAQFPNPVFLQTEAGENADAELTSFGLLDSYAEVDGNLQALFIEPHEFKTVVIDSISKLEKLVQAETCARNNWRSIEAPGYGKGYAEADAVWSEFIEACRFLRDERHMTIVLLAHAIVNRFDDPETQSYSRYEIDLHKRAAAILKREVDAILLVKKDVVIKHEGPQANKGVGRARGDGGDTRWIHCEGRPAFEAGNRYTLPGRLMFEKGKGFEVLAPYLPIPQPKVTEPKAGAKQKAA